LERKVWAVDINVSIIERIEFSRGRELLIGDLDPKWKTVGRARLMEWLELSPKLLGELSGHFA